MLRNPTILAAALAGCLLSAFAAEAHADNAENQQPITPIDGVIRLFNGKDLSGLYTWLKDTKYEDPRDVFTVHDGLLHVSGDGLGAVITKHAYRDYHQVLEFKWGERTWRNRKDRTKDSGLLIHSVGPDGGYNGTWMTSLEVQIIQGGVGDFIMVAGKDEHGKPISMSLTCEVAADRDGELIWNKGGEKRTFTHENRRRVNWFGRDPDWKDALGFRGKNDVEKPDGQWNRLEVISDGGHLTVILNGVTVNEALDCQPNAGKIQLQAELAEIFVRRWELWPLGQAPQSDSHE